MKHSTERYTLSYEMFQMVPGDVEGIMPNFANILDRFYLNRILSN